MSRGGSEGERRPEGGRGDEEQVRRVRKTNPETEEKERADEDGIFISLVVCMARGI
jgi:hypothetical protein